MKKIVAIAWVCMLLFIVAGAQDVTLSGSGTWVVPCNVTSVTVHVYGGGGGAGGGGGGSNGGLFNTRGGGGGGGGGYTTITINVVPGSSFTYGVGAGGGGGSNGSDGSGGGNGSAGGNSTFTGTATGGIPVNLVANGGARGTGGSGTAGSPGNGGAGGTASGGSTNIMAGAGNNGSGGNGGTGGAGVGPAGGAGGPSTGAAGTIYGGGGAGGGNSAGGAGAAGTIFIYYVTTIPNPPIPIVSTTPPTCTATGINTITNYDPAYTYTFNPSNPTILPGGVIDNTVTGLSYTVEASLPGCPSLGPSLPFSKGAQLLTPAAPTITSTAATCTVDGTSTIDFYNAAYTYAFTPAGPTPGAGGLISGMVLGTSYTVTVNNGDCTSNPSTPFSNAAATGASPAPTITSTPPTCSATGTSTIVGYNAANTYTFTPSNPTILPSGVIDNMVTGVSYTVTVAIGGCPPSGASLPFSNAAQLLTPAPPTITSTPATCTADGSSTIDFYNAAITYAFTPAGPTAGAGGAISGMITGTSYTVTADNGQCTSNPSNPFSNVAQLPPAVGSITGSLTYCAGSNTTLTASGGASYIWASVAPPAIIGATPSVTVTQGTYAVEVTGANGCKDTVITTVTATPGAVVTITGQLTYCQGSNTTLTANGATSYVWNDAGNSITPAITVTQGSYTVTGTDGNGCTATANATVTENPLPAAAISGSLTYCTGGNTTLTASGGVGYIWNNGQTTATVTVTQGTYTVTVADANGCTATSSATVTESTSLTVNISGTLTYCPGASTTLTATGGSGYVWSEASTTAAITVTQGTYSVTASDITGCTGTATATVTETVAPVVTITGTLTYCPGANTTLTANGAVGYVWNDPTNSTTASITVTQGSYTVTGTDGTGCTATATATVTENVAPVVTVSGLLTYCTGGNTTLTASGGGGYLWSGGETTASVTVTQGTYSVTATDATGCTGNTTVNVTESSTLAVSITGTLTYCPGASTTITATGGTSYTWNTGATTDVITATAGVYTVTATDASCSGTASANVTQTVVTPLALADVTACDDSTAVVNAGSGFVSYLWSTGETTQTIGTQTAGAYSVTVEDANGCSPSGSANVTFESCVVENFSLFIPNAFSPNGDGNNEKFQCFGSGVIFTDIKVFNRWGEKVFDTNNMFDGWDGTNKGEQCKPGVFTYSINVISADGKSNKYKGTITLIR